MGKGRKHRKEKAYKPPQSIPAIIYKAAEDRTMPKEKPKLIPPDTFQTIAEEMLQTLPAFRNVFMTMCEYRIKDINPQHKETKESPTHMIIFCLRVVSSDQFHPLGVVQIDKRIDQTDKLLEVWKAFIYDLSLLRLIVIGSISPPSITFYKILSQLAKIPKLEEYSGPIVYSVWPFKEIVHLYDYYHLLQETQETLFERSEMCFMAYPPSEELCPLELWKATWTDILLVLASQGIYCYYTTEDENAPPIGIFFTDFYKHYQRARRDGVVATETRTCTDRLMELFCPFTTLLHSHKPFMTPGDLQHFYETNEELRWLLASAKFRKLNPTNTRRTVPGILRKNYCKVSNELLNVPSNYKPKSVLDEMSFSAESSPTSGSVEITESQMETLFKLIDHSISNPNDSNKPADPFDVFLKKVTYDDYDLFLKTQSFKTANQEITKPHENLQLSNATKTPITEDITKPSSSTTNLTNKESTNSEIPTKLQPSEVVSDKEVTKSYSKVPSKKQTKQQQPNDVQNKSSAEQVRPQSSKAVSNKGTKPHRSRSQELNSSQKSGEKLFKPYSSQAIDDKDLTKPEHTAVSSKEVTKANIHEESRKAQSKKVTKSKPVNDVCDKKVTDPHTSKVVSHKESKKAQSKEITKSKPVNEVCEKEVTKPRTSEVVSHKKSKTAQNKEVTKSKQVNDTCDKEMTKQHISKEPSHKDSKTSQSKDMTKSKPVIDGCDKEVNKSHTSKEVSHKGSKTAQNKELTKPHTSKEVSRKGSKTSPSKEISKHNNDKDVTKPQTNEDVSHKETTEPRLPKGEDIGDKHENSNKETILHDHDYFQSESSENSVEKRATNSTIYRLVKDYFGEAINKQINIDNSPKKLSNSNVGDLLANTNIKSQTNLLSNGETDQDSDNQPHLIVDTKKLKNDSEINIDLSNVIQTIAENYQEDKIKLKISLVNSLDKTCKFLKLPRASILQKNVSDISRKTVNKGTNKAQNKKKTESIQSIHIPKGMRGKKWKARRIKARQHAHRLVFNASQMVPVKVKKRRNNWTKINRTYNKAKQGVLSDSNSSDDCENKKTESIKTALKTDEFPSRVYQRKRKEFVKQHIRQFCCKNKNSTSKKCGYQTADVRGKNSTVRENNDNKTVSRKKIGKEPLSPKKNTVNMSSDNSVESSPWPKTSKTYKNSKKSNRNKENLNVKNVDRVDFGVIEHIMSETSTDSITPVNSDSNVNVDVQNKNICYIDAKNNQGDNIKSNKDADTTVECEEDKSKSNKDLASKTSKDDDEQRTNGETRCKKCKKIKLKSNEGISTRTIKDDDPGTDTNVEYRDNNYVSKTYEYTDLTLNKDVDNSKICKNADSTTSKNNDEEIQFEVNISLKPVISDHTENNDETDSDSSDLDSIDSLEELAVSMKTKPSKLPNKYIIPKIPRVSLQTTSQNNDPKVKTLDESQPLASDLHNGFGTFTNGNSVNGYGKYNGSHSGDSADSESHDSIPEKKILGVDDHQDKSTKDNPSKKNDDICDNDLKTCVNGKVYEDKNCADGCNIIENKLSHSSKLKKSSGQIQADENSGCGTSQKAVDRIETDEIKLLVDSSVKKNEDDFYNEAKDIFEASQKYTAGQKEQIVSFLDLIESTVTDGIQKLGSTDKSDLAHQNIKNVLEEAENICRRPPDSDNVVLFSVKEDNSTPNDGKGECSNGLDASDVISQKDDVVIKSSIKKNMNKLPSKWKDVIIDVHVESFSNDDTSTNAVLEKDISNEPAEATEIDYFSDDSLEIEIPNKPVSDGLKSDNFVINMDAACVGNGLCPSRKSMSEDSIDKLDTMNTVANQCSGIVEDSFNNLRSAVYILQEISELNRSIVNDKGISQSGGSGAKSVRGAADILRDINALTHRAGSLVNGDMGGGFSKADIQNHLSNINKKLIVNNSFLTAGGLKNDFVESIDYKEYKRSLEVCDNRESNCDIIYKDRETFKALYGRIPDDFETLRLSNDWLSTLKGYVKLKEILTARKVKCFHATALNLEHVDFYVHLIKKSKNHVPSTYHGQTYRFLDYRCAFDLLSLGKGVYVVSKDDDVVGDKVS